MKLKNGGGSNVGLFGLVGGFILILIGKIIALTPVIVLGMGMMVCMPMIQVCNNDTRSSKKFKDKGSSRSHLKGYSGGSLFGNKQRSEYNNMQSGYGNSHNQNSFGSGFRNKKEIFDTKDNIQDKNRFSKIENSNNVNKTTKEESEEQEFTLRDEDFEYSTLHAGSGFSKHESDSISLEKYAPKVKDIQKVRPKVKLDYLNKTSNKKLKVVSQSTINKVLDDNEPYSDRLLETVLEKDFLGNRIFICRDYAVPRAYVSYYYFEDDCLFLVLKNGNKFKVNLLTSCSLKKLSTHLNQYFLTAKYLDSESDDILSICSKLVNEVEQKCSEIEYDDNEVVNLPNDLEDMNIFDR